VILQASVLLLNLVETLLDSLEAVMPPRKVRLLFGTSDGASISREAGPHLPRGDQGEEHALPAPRPHITG
jgi:hypothetical protein